MSTYLRCLNSQALFTFEDIWVFSKVINLFAVKKWEQHEIDDDITKPPQRPTGFSGPDYFIFNGVMEVGSFRNLIVKQ